MKRRLGVCEKGKIEKFLGARRRIASIEGWPRGRERVGPSLKCLKSVGCLLEETELDNSCTARQGNKESSRRNTAANGGGEGDEYKADRDRPNCHKMGERSLNM